MKRYTQEQINELVEILKKNGVISVPTDTVFGVCARMMSEAAEDRLRDVKNRPLTKSFPIMCADEAQIKDVAYVSQRDEKLIRAFMPGPVTFVLRKKESVPGFVNGNMPTLAIRMATSAALKTLIQKLGEPVYMTSANQSGMPVCTSLDEIENACPKLDAMMEGSVSYGEASTIVDCSGDEIKVLRQGPVTLAQLLEVAEG